MYVKCLKHFEKMFQAIDIRVLSSFFNYTWHHMHVILQMHMFEHKIECNFISIFVSILITKWKIYVQH
jgi:hypothetical protein